MFSGSSSRPSSRHNNEPLESRQITSPPDLSALNFDCEGPSDKKYIIYIKSSQWNNETAVAEVEDLLERRKTQNSRGYEKVEGPSHVWAYIAHNMHVDVAKVFGTLLAVEGIPGEDFEIKMNKRRAVPEPEPEPEPDHTRYEWEDGGGKVVNASVQQKQQQPEPAYVPSLPLGRRAVQTVPLGQAWHLSQMSVPENVQWLGNGAYVRPAWVAGPNQQMVAGEEYVGYWDDSYGQGQWVYIWEDDVYTGHRVGPASFSLSLLPLFFCQL